MDHFKPRGFALPELETTSNGYLTVDLFLVLSGYATAMLMAGMRPAFCAKQLGHSIDIVLKA